MIAGQPDETIPGRCGLLEWQLAYRADQQVVALQTSGPIDKLSLPAMLEATVELAQHHQCHRILADHRNSTLQLDPLEIYYAPRAISASCAGERFFVALIFSRMTEDLQFMENVCRNAGLALLVATDMESALQWLKAVSDPPAVPQPPATVSPEAAKP